MNKGLTLTIIFEGQSLNYDEGFGNLSTLKKMRRGNGDVYSFASRQSLRYAIFTQGIQQFGWIPADVDEAGKTKKVIQPKSDITIEISEELDLFGYMKTNVEVTKDIEVTITRVAPVRILPAFSLEPFLSDIEMLTNKYQSDKIQSQPNIANAEVHRSLYRYTIVIDLERIGSEQNNILTKISPNKREVKTNLLTKETKEFKDFVSKLRSYEAESTMKNQRIGQLLDVIKTLFRDIRGRREDLKPLFIIGGLYDNKNPFFANIINVDWEKGKPKIDFSGIKQLLNSEEELLENTFLGIRDGFFKQNTNDLINEIKKDNEDNSIKETRTKEKNGNNKHINILNSPEAVIEKIKEKVQVYYLPNN